jgi:sortase A
MTIDTTSVRADGTPAPDPATKPVGRRRATGGGRFNRRAADRAPARAADPLGPGPFAALVAVGTLALLAAWTLFYALALSGIQEAHTQRVIFSHLREQLALATSPIGGAIKPGVPVGLISMPTIKVYRTVFVEGTASSQLEKGPGHLPNTPLPGQAGVSEIFGRSTTFGRPFAKLHSLKAGDPINITDGQGTYTFTVEDVRTPGDLLPAALPAGTPQVTLVTSQSHGWTGGWGAGNVLYVDAKMTKGQVQPTPAGMPTTIPSADAPFHSDTSQLVRLVLWLQLLVLIGAATAYAWSRWTRRQTWLVAAPALLAALWGATAALLPLLPNLS